MNVNEILCNNYELLKIFAWNIVILIFSCFSAGGLINQRAEVKGIGYSRSREIIPKLNIVFDGDSNLGDEKV
jgi:hypothetical protein